MTVLHFLDLFRQTVVDLAEPESEQGRERRNTCGQHMVAVVTLPSCETCHVVRDVTPEIRYVVFHLFHAFVIIQNILPLLGPFQKVLHGQIPPYFIKRNTKSDYLLFTLVDFSVVGF